MDLRIFTEPQQGATYDDRLRVYRSSSHAIGIKPSQLEAPLTRVFSYVNRKSPSIYPKSGGYFVWATERTPCSRSIKIRHFGI